MLTFFCGGVANFWGDVIWQILLPHFQKFFCHPTSKRILTCHPPKKFSTPPPKFSLPPHPKIFSMPPTKTVLPPYSQKLFPNILLFHLLKNLPLYRKIVLTTPLNFCYCYPPPKFFSAPTATSSIITVCPWFSVNIYA